MVALGDADALVTGVTRNYSIALEDVRQRHRREARPPRHRAPRSCLARGTGPCWWPTRPSPRCRTHRTSPRSRSRRQATARRSRLRAARRAAGLLDLRPSGRRALDTTCSEAVKILDGMRVDFEYDGDMAADVALNRDLMAAYPFCRLTGPANVLVMPAFHSASIATRMMSGTRRLDRDRPPDRRARQTGADRLARRHRFRHRAHGGACGLRCRLSGAVRAVMSRATPR